jgi:glyoxylase-like metal-dependent hydrolase (beta-lactamase superfamily II)
LLDLVQDITPNLKYLSSRPPIAGYKDFIGTYLILGEKKALVDVGPKAAITGLLTALLQAGVSPDEIDYIILTHIHIDHAGGVGLAVKEMKNTRVIAHSRAYNHLVDPTALWKASQETLGGLAIKYGSIDSVSENRIIVAEDGMRLDMGKGLVLEIYLTPGHAPHHLCVFDSKNGILLSGDLAGIYTNDFLRPSTPPPFRMQDYLTSVDRMIALQPAKLGYAHSGCYDNAIERLRAVRAQTLLWYEIVQAGARDSKTAEDIVQLIMAKDKTIRKLNDLDKDTYQREYLMLVNNIHGLMTAKKNN